jgi:3-dehydroquinate dehydratase II
MKILIIHGPNLNLLGIREPEIYGLGTQNDLFKYLEKSFETINFLFFQSNHEGEIIDKLHRSMQINIKDSPKIDAIIINPGAFSHYSYAIRDAILSINLPIIEVHLSDINNREDFRKKSVISDVCIDTISGKGKKGYIEAINKLLEI